MCYKLVRNFRGIGCLLLILVFATAGKGQPEKDFLTIRERLVATLLAAPVTSVQVEGIITEMTDDGIWPSINYRDTSKTGFEHRIHLENLLTMAKAYHQGGGKYNHDARVLEAFKKAFGHWLRKDYRCENWWWNEIGTPSAMANILLLMRNELDIDELSGGLAIVGRSNFDGFGARPGGDFVKMAAIKAIGELVAQDTAEFAMAIKTMADQIYITEERGIKPDMSFHHRVDWVPSTLSYGRQYASTFVYWGHVLRGTRFAFEPRALALITDFYLDGIRKAMPFGRFTDPGIKNRDVSRRSSPGEWRDDGIASSLAQIGDYRKAELVQPDLRSNRYFWYSHYHSHQRPAYFASVRMYSDRANNMEWPHNEEGLKNHFYADGSQFISRTGREYINIYPSWDWRKIPGTTVVQVDSFPRWEELVKKGTTSFVGGVSDGEYGATAFDFHSPFSGVSARKSWFFFDDEIVCLGAGITADAPQPVVTTLNQSLSYGPTWVNGSRKTEELELELQGPLWVNHDSIGYILLDTGEVWLRQGKSTGTWRSISHQDAATDEPVTQQIFTLTVDHGARPRDAAYAYVVLPAVGEHETATYAQQRPVEVVSNTTAVQAVSHTGLGVHHAVFYEPGAIDFPGGLRLASAEPALFTLKVSAEGIERISVADPTRKLEKLSFRLQLPDGRDTALTVALPRNQFAGKSLLIGPLKAGYTPFLLREDVLAAHQQRITEGDALLTADLDTVLRLADLALARKPYSVTEKSKVPPSGDKHDYMSVGPYWWPDTTKPDGLPYIRKDGQTNPERFAIKDAQYVKELCADVQLLAASYYFTQHEKYAQHAAKLLETWFLDEQTKMNPNLNFGQSIPGVTDGRGIGLIDTWHFAKLLDATQLLTVSPHWGFEKHAQLQTWVKEFLHWMLESEIGKDEADEHNNHGTYYDVQIASYALFVGDTALAKQTLERATKARLESQLEADGRQPHELARTRSWSYSLMNLTGFFMLARLGENVGVDLWDYRTQQGKTIGKAFDYLLPYGLRRQEWPYPQLGGMDFNGFDKLMATEGLRYMDRQTDQRIGDGVPSFNRLTGSFL
ncbi:alginate lyase family protein [Parapedobacter sp. ISTM3]|uniref:alginate lyase family protein n=1 Tax=Parapedobacter sp. ISTM3 TaxID=2800130 RepID=UPI001904C894|nr:alginate lyase family protein [Parapedobacter sp. ISTM3]MBK1442027.1 alginate lyase family protein [Parapedobacter sp. ISTM3]